MNAKKLLTLSFLNLFLLTSVTAQAGLGKKSTAPKPAEDVMISSASSTSSNNSSGHWLTTGPQKSISFSFPSGGNAGIGGSYALDEDHSLRAEFGLDLNNTSSFVWGLSLDLGYRTTLKKISSIKVFSQPNIFFAKTTTGANFGKSLVIAPGCAIGAEYFFHENVSIGISTGLSVTFSNGFSNFNLATGTSGISANFYF